MDFFRDPVWQFVGAVLAALAIIIPIVIFLFERRKKSLVYEIISRTAVLSASDEIAERLQIFFQGDRVRNVFMLVFKLTNNGNVSVTSADYEKEISFIFNDSEKILTAEVSETKPSKLSTEIEIKLKSIIVKPLLLNPGDSITIKTLISEFKKNIDVEGRVIGVKSIDEKKESSGWGYTVTIIGLSLFSIGALLLFTAANQIGFIFLLLSGFLNLIGGFGLVFNWLRGGKNLISLLRKKI